MDVRKFSLIMCAVFIQNLCILREGHAKDVLENDNLNLENLGAKLDNTKEDEERIQKIYNNLKNGDVVEIPATSKWNGRIEAPNPNKHITWMFKGDLPGAYTPPPGDGDTSIFLGSAAFHAERRDTHTKNFGYPAYFMYWNDDSNYCGMWCGNFQQYAAATFKGISGPSSTGHTSPINISLDSYGKNPSDSYDIGINNYVTKFGQNSTWGILDATNDFSGKSPGFAASWNEFDVWTNGYDIKPWDKTYGSPQAGHRSVFFVGGAHHTVPAWTAAKAVSGPSTAKGALPQPYLIDVIGSDNVHYVWYAVQTGVTGSKKPIFAVPSKFNATISNGIMTVNNLVSGDLQVGDYVTGEIPITPAKIIAQTSGKLGGVGKYELSDSKISTDDSAFEAAPHVVDGTVIWEYGEELNSSVSSLLFFTGSPGDEVDTMVGAKEGVILGNAAVDTSLMTFQNNSAVVRAASGQPIDFSSNGSIRGANKHTLDYDNGALRYKVDGITVVSIKDDGSIISSLPVQLPTFTRAQIRAYPSPKLGMELYDTSDHSIAIYTDSGWKLLSTSSMPNK